MALLFFADILNLDHLRKQQYHLVNTTCGTKEKWQGLLRPGSYTHLQQLHISEGRTITLTHAYPHSCTWILVITARLKTGWNSTNALVSSTPKSLSEQEHCLFMVSRSMQEALQLLSTCWVWGLGLTWYDLWPLEQQLSSDIFSTSSQRSSLPQQTWWQGICMCASDASMQKWYLSLLLNMGRGLKQDIAQKCRHVSLSPSYGVAVGEEFHPPEEGGAGTHHVWDYPRWRKEVIGDAEQNWVSGRAMPSEALLTYKTNFSWVSYVDSMYRFVVFLGRNKNSYRS